MKSITFFGKADRRSWLVVGCIGYSLFFCWMWILYFGNFAEIQAGIGLHNIALMRIVMLLALLASLPVIVAFSQRLAMSRGYRVSAGIAIALCPLAALTSFLFPCECGCESCGIACLCASSIAHLVAWGLSGVGYAFFMAHWSWFDSALVAVKRRSRLLIGIMIASAVEFLLTSLMVPVAMAVVSILISIASVILSLCALSMFAEKGGEAAYSPYCNSAMGGATDLRKMEGKISRKSLTLTFFSGVALGFCGYTTASILPDNTCDIVLSGCMIVAGGLLYLVSRDKGGFPPSRLMWLYVPFASYCLIPMCIFAGLPRAVLASALIAALTAYSFVDLDMMIADFGVHSSSLVGIAARGRTGNVVGLIVGWGIALVVGCTPDANGDVFRAVCLGVVLLLVTASTFVFRDSGFRSLPALIEYSSDDIRSMRCTSIAEKYGLTKRQREVFELLARGRTAPFICDKLSISESTAKTHIYNIYQKLGIHAQRDLMDLVDSWEIISDDVLHRGNK